MPSEAAKKRQAQKKERKATSSRSAQKRSKAKTEDELVRSNGDVEATDGACAAGSGEGGVTRGVAALTLSARSCTGG